VADQDFPDVTIAPGGAAPSAFILHHTAGRGDPASVVKFWQQQGKGYGAQYIMDRDGVIHDTAKEFGYNGTNEILDDPTHKLSNRNTVGMEIVANDDKDVTPAQAQAAAAFIQARYPNTPVFGHGQVNPGRKEPTEGATALNATLALRSQAGLPPLGTTINTSANQGPESVGAGAPRATSTGPQDPRQIVFNKLVAAGVPKQAALGALWSLGGEGGAGLDPRSYNANDPGGSIGYGQWNGVRRTALENLAKANGTSWADPNTQADHIVNELTNKDYASYQPGVLAKLQEAKTPQEAASIWTSQFERPKVDNSDQRIKGGAQVATLDDKGNLVLGSATGGGGTPNVAGTTINTTPQGPLGKLSSALGAPETQNFEQKAQDFEKQLTGDQGQRPPEMLQMGQPPGLVNSSAPILRQMAAQMHQGLTGYPTQGQAYGATINSPPLQFGAGTPELPPWMQQAGLQQQPGWGLSLNSLMAQLSPYYAASEGYPNYG
jgi:hypothetical protein